VEPYIWLTPVLVLLAGVLLYPWVSSLVLSFEAWTPLRPIPPRFVGFDNYLRLIQNQQFLGALQNTAVLAVGTIILQVVGGFAIALLLNEIRIGRSVLLVMYLLPLMVTPSVIGLSWKLLLHDQWGVLNWALTSLGMPRVGWLSDPAWTMPTIVMVDVWQNMPFGVLVLLAGLQGVPDEQVEAAKIDGASPVQTFRHIVLPFLTPLILITLLFRLIFALRTFDVIYSLFRSGGPANSGMVVGVYLYEQLRTAWQIGQASATSYVLLLLTMLLASVFILRWYRGAES
jgi:multiple sugar transport system permease protein